MSAEIAPSSFLQEDSEPVPWRRPDAILSSKKKWRLFQWPEFENPRNAQNSVESRQNQERYIAMQHMLQGATTDCTSFTFARRYFIFFTVT